MLALSATMLRLVGLVVSVFSIAFYLALKK